MSRGPLLAAAVACVLIGAAGTSVAGAATQPPPSVTLTFVGDSILGNTPQLPSEPKRYLSPVVRELTEGSDVVFGNLEGTLTNGGPSKCGSGSGGTCYAFRNPPSYAKVFAGAGFDVLSGANNHSYDFGATGLSSTKQALHDAAVHYTGMPGQITYVKRHGIHVAFVAFAPYGRTNNLLDLATAARLVRQAHAHAPVVVVYMHAGAEGASADHVTGHEEHYVGEDRGNPRRFAHLAIDNGASVVVASGPHVLRGMEFYKHRLIAYSLGDFANYHNFSSSGTLSRSAILHVTLTARGRFSAAMLTSVQLSSGGHATLGGDTLPFVRSLSRQDFGPAAARITKRGQVLPP